MLVAKSLMNNDMFSDVQLLKRQIDACTIFAFICNRVQFWKSQSVN